MSSKLLNSPTVGEVLVLKVDIEHLLSVSWNDAETNKLKSYSFEFSDDEKGHDALDRSFNHARDNNIDFLIGGL
jgi:hypothetical protein